MYDLAYHRKIELEEAGQARALADYLYARFLPASVVDIGCSTGVYLREWEKFPVRREGLEFSSDAVANRLTPAVRQFDLSMPAITTFRSNLGICLEVLEHIPAGEASTVLDNINLLVSDWLVFSAAVPGQGGVGHVNCQTKPYWINRFERRGFVVDFVETVEMLANMRGKPCMGWFLRNAMVFRRYRGRV